MVEAKPVIKVHKEIKDQKEKLDPEDLLVKVRKEIKEIKVIKDLQGPIIHIEDFKDHKAIEVVKANKD